MSFMQRRSVEARFNNIGASSSMFSGTGGSTSLSSYSLSNILASPASTVNGGNVNVTSPSRAQTPVSVSRTQTPVNMKPTVEQRIINGHNHVEFPSPAISEGNAQTKDAKQQEESKGKLSFILN